MHGTLALDRLPGGFKAHAPWTSGRRRVTQPAALIACLQVKIVLRAMAEIFEVLDVEIVDRQTHAHIFTANWHLIGPCSK
jgi:hypothetical protein